MALQTGVDKLFVASNKVTDGSVKFSVVRYGNEMGSRGSVIPSLSLALARRRQ